ncbi:MAG TPA: sensor histidine kinase [Polyangia bacterium]|nr:sensor histidine kinase [Polyangia bacterium]
MSEKSTGANLYEVLAARRGELITRWSERLRGGVVVAPLLRTELLDHMPAFIDEIIRALYPDAVPLPPSSAQAEEHGEQRLRLGFDVAEVVREYGALHECILQIAGEAGLAVSLRDQEVVARLLNAGIAAAVFQYVKHRDLEMQRQASEHLGFIAHELRNPLGAAQLAFHLLRGELPESRTVERLDRNLRQTAEMINSVLSHASLKMGVEPRPAPIALEHFLREIESDAELEAQTRKIEMIVSAPKDLTVQADPRLLRSAISNLLQNALKFSREGSKVTLTAVRTDGRVTIEVADACGGLPPGKAAELFTPLVQRSENRSGFGLGLAIALQAAEAHNGTIKVRDIPGVGCAFIIDLPSSAPG